MKVKLTAAISALILAFSINTYALEIELGSRALEISVPEGFIELTPEMPPAYEALRSYIAPSNTRYLTIITKEKASALLRGENTELDRYMNVESATALSTVSVTPAQFEELKSTYKNQLDQIYASAKDSIAGALKDGDQKLSDTYNVDVAVELTGQAILPVHEDTDRTIANSIVLTVGGSIDDVDLEKKILVGTTTFLYVKDRILFLYVYGVEGDLEWSREVSRKWASEISSANP